jgi:hypothetical protein
MLACAAVMVVILAGMEITVLDGAAREQVTPGNWPIFTSNQLGAPQHG